MQAWPIGLQPDMSDQTPTQPDLLDRLGNWLNPALALAILTAAFTLWQWWNTHNQLHLLRQEVAQNLTSSANNASQARLLAQQNSDALRELSQQLVRLQAEINASQSQEQALQAMYRNMAESRDEWTLADIAQVVQIANQQLLINGNVKAAIIALQSADTRLQTLNRPQLAGLHLALQGDIEHLQALPRIDTLGLTARIDHLISMADSLPLSDEHEIVRPAPALPPEPKASGLTQRFALELWHELQGLVQVLRLDTPDTALLLPEQSYFLRQNLKLRLLTARIALFAHDQHSYQTDLQAADTWLHRYFNVRDVRTQSALNDINVLLLSPVSLQMPGLNASLQALHASHLLHDNS